MTVEPATGETARRLGATTVHRVDRVRIVDGVPLALESARLAGEFPDLAAELDRRGSLYATLREAYGVALQAVEDTVQTHLADPATAELLGVETGHPLLLVHRLGETTGGRPVEWTRSAYRGDRFRFVARTALGPATTDATALCSSGAATAGIPPARPGTRHRGCADRRASIGSRRRRSRRNG